MVARSSVTGLTKLSENLMLPVGSKRNLIMFHKSMGSLLSKKLGFQYNHMKFATNTNMTVLNVICKQPVRKVGIFYLHPILTKSTPIRYANLNNHNITINSTNVIIYPLSSGVMITIWSQYHHQFNQCDLLPSRVMITTQLTCRIFRVAVANLAANGCRKIEMLGIVIVIMDTGFAIIDKDSSNASIHHVQGTIFW